MDKSELPEEITTLIKAAEAGNASAQFNLGLKYQKGDGVEQNDQQALVWCRKAAEQGHSKAQFNLALMYVNGQSVEQSDQEALGWYRKAAENGFVLAQFNLALMYDNGQGVEQNDQEALVWYRKAAEQGHSSAQFNLAIMYDIGQGVEQNYQEAFIWYRKAAEQGDVTAQFNLALMYANGQGINQSDQEALAWYRKAAEQEYARAQFNLALMYINGQGVKKSDEEAITWFRKAALSTNPDVHFKAIEYQDKAERHILSPKITDIRSFILKLLRVNIDKSPTMTHYTSLFTGEQLLLKGSPFRLGHINSLNDPSEGKLLWHYLGHSHTEGNPVFIGCFLPDDDSLNMWRFYSKNHHKDDACGCAITFGAKNFINFNLLEKPHEYKPETKNNIAFINTGKSPQESAAFYQVVYLDDSMNIHGNDAKDAIIKSLGELKNEVSMFLGDSPTDEKFKQLARLLGPLPYLFKDADYAAEQEHRIIISHLEYGAKEIQALEPTMENGIPQTAPKLYLELHRTNHLDPVKHVTLGPKAPHQEMMAPYWHHKLASEFREQLEGKPDFYIRASKCAYK